MEVVVNNGMQVGYRYIRDHEIGDLSDLYEKYQFSPDLTPMEMLSLGVFGGKYFNDVVETDEYPQEWWVDAKMVGVGQPANDLLNFFGVAASVSLREWEQRGWISDQDPRGWFEWYARTYMGRRSPDDERQIRRHRQFKRHLAQLKKYCEKGDWSCRPRQRQALLHWAYDSRIY